MWPHYSLVQKLTLLPTKMSRFSLPPTMQKAWKTSGNTHVVLYIYKYTYIIIHICKLQKLSAECRTSKARVNQDSLIPPTNLSAYTMKIYNMHAAGQCFSKGLKSWSSSREQRWFTRNSQECTIQKRKTSLNRSPVGVATSISTTLSNQIGQLTTSSYTNTAANRLHSVGSTDGDYPHNKR